jgi:RNA polymerase sigma-70 factor (ECF subfamily)
VQQAQEDDWIVRAQQGDRQAFMALVERYWGRVQRWLAGLSRCRHTAEDLAQEAFLKAWSHLASFRPGTSFRAWLFRIAANAFIDSRRGPRGRPPRPLPPALGAREPGPVAVALGRECQARLDEACTRLPTPLRAAFLLRTQEDLSFAEIGQALGITEETARWRLFKARQRLLRELGEYLDEPPT